MPPANAGQCAGKHLPDMPQSLCKAIAATEDISRKAREIRKTFFLFGVPAKHAAHCNPPDIAASRFYCLTDNIMQTGRWSLNPELYLGPMYVLYGLYPEYL